MPDSHVQGREGKQDEAGAAVGVERGSNTIYLGDNMASAQSSTSTLTLRPTPSPCPSGLGTLAVSMDNGSTDDDDDSPFLVPLTTDTDSNSPISSQSSSRSNSSGGGGQDLEHALASVHLSPSSSSSSASSSFSMSSSRTSSRTSSSSADSISTSGTSTSSTAIEGDDKALHAHSNSSANKCCQKSSFSHGNVYDSHRVTPPPSSPVSSDDIVSPSSSSDSLTALVAATKANHVADDDSTTAGTAAAAGICSSSTGVSTPTLSRAISCAHGECVMAGPCQRMIELSRIRKYKRDRRGKGGSQTDNKNNGNNKVQLMILDNACGPSALVTSQLMDALPLELLEEAQLVATDLSEKAVVNATRRVADLEWADHVFTMKMDMLRMEGLGDGGYTHVFTNFGISLAKDAHAALREMHRILAPGGVCAFTVWKRLSWLDLLAEAIKSEYKHAPAPFPSHDEALLSLSRWYSWHEEDFIRKMLKETGFPEFEEIVSSVESPQVEGIATKEYNTNVKDTVVLKEKVEDIPVPLEMTKLDENDWSTYEYTTEEALKGAKLVKKIPKLPNASDIKKKEDEAMLELWGPKPIWKPTKLSRPIPVSPKKRNVPVPQRPKSNVLIEEYSSTHRYTKHEFMMNFGTTVMEHILSQSWGRKQIESADVKRNLRTAVWKHLVKCYPGEMTEIELDFTALVVVTRKSTAPTVRTGC